MAKIIKLSDSCNITRKLYLNADNIRYFHTVEDGNIKFTKIYIIDQESARGKESAEAVMRLINN